MIDNTKQHLTPQEVDLWAEGLLATDRTMHLAECGHCLALAEAERRLLLELAQLPRFAPAADFADRVMAQVKVPTPADGFRPLKP
jgi:hypothetical protein